MLNFTYTWQSSNNEKIWGQGWQPEGDVDAVLCIVHGHGEHCSRYAPMAEYFGHHRIATLSYDAVGHGQSGGKRGYIDSFDTYRADAQRLVTKAREMYPGVPVFLFGHSMGGLVVATYILKDKPTNITGVILSAPMFSLSFEVPGWKLIASRIMYKIYPYITLPSDLDPRSISRDPAEVVKYENDPLVHGMANPVIGVEGLDDGIWAVENAGSFSLPLLIYHGTGDKITSCKSSEEFASKVKSDITWKAYEGYYHELHNDNGREEVLEMILNWLQTRY